MLADLSRNLANIAMTVISIAITTLIVQRATVVHSFEPVPAEQRAALRFCATDPWRLTVKNLSFISVQGLKVAFVYSGLSDTKIETDRDWKLYPNGPTDKKDSGRYYSWELGNQLAGETANIVFCFPNGLNAADIRTVNNRPRLYVRTNNANSIDVTESATRPLLEAPLVIVLLGWLAALGIVVYGIIKLLGFLTALLRRRRSEPAAGGAPPA